MGNGKTPNMKLASLNINGKAVNLIEAPELNLENGLNIKALISSPLPEDIRIAYMNASTINVKAVSPGGIEIAGKMRVYSVVSRPDIIADILSEPGYAIVLGE